MTENAALCASHLYLNVAAEPAMADLIVKARRAAAEVAGAWAVKTKGHPLMDLTALRVERDGAESVDVLSLDDIDQALSHGDQNHYLWCASQHHKFDPTKPARKWDTAWRALRDAAGLPGFRFHDL